MVRVRTTYRQPQEDVYIYRTRAPLRNIRRVFLDDIKTMNDIRRQAQFYNTLTTNCTTIILMHTRMNREAPPMSWKILLSGYVLDYLYELGGIDTATQSWSSSRMSMLWSTTGAATVFRLPEGSSACWSDLHGIDRTNA